MWLFLEQIVNLRWFVWLSLIVFCQIELWRDRSFGLNDLPFEVKYWITNITDSPKPDAK